MTGMTQITVPHVAESFVSETACKSIIRLIERYAAPESNLRTLRSVSGRTLIAARSVYVDGFHQEAALLADIVARCQAEIECHFDLPNPIFPGFIVLQGNYPGDSHERHADSRRFDKTEGQWIPNHTPNWVISCGVYLNRCGKDFTGGELVFPALGKKVAGAPGLLVAYPSDERFEHEVPAVTSGSRYSILIWFTDNPEAKDQPIIPSTKRDIQSVTASEPSDPPVEMPEDQSNGHHRRGQLVIVGSGIAAISHFTLETIGYIKDADIVFYHANSGVTAAYVRELNPNAIDLYEYYGEGKVRTITYIQMAELMLRKVREGLSVVGLFHGHPGFFVQAARRSLAIAKTEGYYTALIPAVSAIDCLFADLRIDPGVSGIQILKASYVLRNNISLATENNVVLIQIGSVGDNTFSFSGFKHAKFELLFEKLISIYGDNHDSVYYVAPIFPGLDPVIKVRKLSEYRQYSVRDTLHAATLYLPPAGISFASLTTRQAFRGREPYGDYEKQAISELKAHHTPPGYKLRGASGPMLRAILELGTRPAAQKCLRETPEQFIERHSALTVDEREALLSRETAKLRTITTKKPDESPQSQ